MRELGHVEGRDFIADGKGEMPRPSDVVHIPPTPQVSVSG
jgi:hypothetical protein